MRHLKTETPCCLCWHSACDLCQLRFTQNEGRDLWHRDTWFTCVSGSGHSFSPSSPMVTFTLRSLRKQDFGLLCSGLPVATHHLCITLIFVLVHCFKDCVMTLESKLYANDYIYTQTKSDFIGFIEVCNYFIIC